MESEKRHDQALHCFLFSSFANIPHDIISTLMNTFMLDSGNNSIEIHSIFHICSLVMMPQRAV